MRDTLLKNYQKDYDRELAKLDRVKDMRINGEIDANGYNVEKEKILAEKERIQRLINGIDADIDKHVIRLEQKLTFAETACARLKEDLETQRQVPLVSLGSNFILKDNCPSL